MIIYVVTTLILITLTYLLTRYYFIKRLKEDYLKIEELTTLDIKTGLYNRKFFDKIFISEFHRARRIKHPISLMFLETKDCIEFSKIMLSSIKRDTDFVSKYEENILVGVFYDTNSDGLDYVIKRIMDNLNGLEINIGVHSVIPDSHTSSINLIDEALKALIRSKNRGPNRIEFSLNSI